MEDMVNKYLEDMLLKAYDDIVVIIKKLEQDIADGIVEDKGSTIKCLEQLKDIKTKLIELENML